MLQGAAVTPFGPLLLHSVIVAVGSTALALVLGLFAAYALARIRFRGKRFLAMWILSTIMFPPVVAVIPVFIVAGRLQLIDRYPTLIVPYAAFNHLWSSGFCAARSGKFPRRSKTLRSSTAHPVWRSSPASCFPSLSPGIRYSGDPRHCCWRGIEFLFALTLTRSRVQARAGWHQ